MRHALPHTPARGVNMLPFDSIEGTLPNARYLGPYWSGARTLETGDAHTGTSCLKVTGPDDTRTHGCIFYSTWLYPLGDGSSKFIFRGGIWFKGPAGKEFRLSGRIQDASNVYISEGFGEVYWTATGSWQYVETTDIRPAVGLRVYMVGLQVTFRYAPSSADSFWVDDVSIVRTDVS